MIYFLLFLVRFLPFWAIPVALVFFEVGMHYYQVRQRAQYLFAFFLVFLLITFSVLWLLFDGYWKGPLWVKSIFL